MNCLKIWKRILKIVVYDFFYFFFPSSPIQQDNRIQFEILQIKLDTPDKHDHIQTLYSWLNLDK